MDMENDRYDELISLMGKGIYSKDEMCDLIYRVFPSYSYNSSLWVLGDLMRIGRISALGFGLYQASQKEEFHLELSDYEQCLFEMSKIEFPNSPSCIFSTAWLDSKLDLHGGPDITIIETEKDKVFGLYYLLHGKEKRGVMVEPKEHDLEMYFSPGNVVVKKLFSKSPVREDGSIRIEKLMVDLLSDRLIQYFYRGVDFAEFIQSLVQNYAVNYSTLLTYAKRRCVDNEIKSILKGVVSPNIWTIIQNK